MDSGLPGPGAVGRVGRNCLMRGGYSLEEMNTGNVLNATELDFPEGSVVKIPSASAGDKGSIPGPGRPHMP